MNTKENKKKGGMRCGWKMNRGKPFTIKNKHSYNAHWHNKMINEVRDAITETNVFGK